MKQIKVAPAKVEEPDDRLTRVEKAIERLEKTLAREASSNENFEDDEMQSELRDKDHRSHMTMAMTLGSPKDLEKSSDIGSAEEMAYLTSQDVDAQIMSPLFDIPRISLLAHKISKDRKSREEYRDILKSGSYMQDQFGGIYSSGPQMLRKAILDEHEEDEGGT
jgi:hypothetical protein